MATLPVKSGMSLSGMKVDVGGYAWEKEDMLKRVYGC